MTLTHLSRMGIYAEPASYTDSDGSVRQTVLVMAPRVTMEYKREGSAIPEVREAIQ